MTHSKHCPWIIALALIGVLSCSNDKDGEPGVTTDIAASDSQSNQDGGADTANDIGSLPDTEPVPDAGTIEDAEPVADTAPIPDTAPVEDTAPVPDTAPIEDTAPMEDTAPPVSTMSANIEEPAADQVFETGTSIHFKGLVADSLFAPETLTVEWASNKDGVLDTTAATADGVAAFDTDTLSPGMHLITLKITNANGQEHTGWVEVGICQWASPDKFDINTTGSKWQTYGDAFWDPGGWLEMTGNVKGKKGAIFNTVDYLTPGDITLSFKILTGPNVGTGADGFALSVFRAKDIPELESWIAAAHSGGGLGYAISGNYGPVIAEAFHVEIDTWHNIYNGNSEFHTDPTPENHIAITLNGDPGNHVLWAAVPNIEDMQWHDITVEVVADHVKVTLDGSTIIDKTVPDFLFRGGYIGFTGTTGYYTNYHRFDELQILQECLVP